MRKLASKTFGDDYECKKEWPEDCYVQCGDSGLVIGKEKSKSYITAFFEAFPNEPKTFIRGEGKDLEEAESKAYSLFLKYSACAGHVFVRRDDSEHGNCSLCGMFASNVLEPVFCCSVCNKEKSNIDFGGKHYCVEHFIEAVKPFKGNYNLDEIQPYYGVFSEYEINKYHIEKALYLSLCIKHNLFNNEIPEYIEFNRIEKEDYKFRLHLHNVALSRYKQINEKEKILKLSIHKFSKIKDLAFIDENVYENLFMNFHNISEIDSISYNAYFDKVVTLYQNNNNEE